MVWCGRGRVGPDDGGADAVLLASGPPLSLLKPEWSLNNWLPLPHPNTSLFSLISPSLNASLSLSLSTSSLTHLSLFCLFPLPLSQPLYLFYLKYHSLSLFHPPSLSLFSISPSLSLSSPILQVFLLCVRGGSTDSCVCDHLEARAG